MSMPASAFAAVCVLLFGLAPAMKPPANASEAMAVTMRTLRMSNLRFAAAFPSAGTVIHLEARGACEAAHRVGRNIRTIAAGSPKAENAAAHAKCAPVKRYTLQQCAIPRAPRHSA